ncbi:MAG: phosphatidylglycerophosphatase A [Elusimicrobiota bacterium]
MKAVVLFDRICVAVATNLYLSYIPVRFSKGTRFALVRRWTGAGLVGSLVGWGLLYTLPKGDLPFAVALAAGITIAIITSHRAERHFKTHDDPRIIVDETVGYWTAVAWLPREPGLLLLGLVLFRFFDAVKLPPYRWLERLPGGAGVVMDDIGAGVAANLLLRGLCMAWPGLLG